MATVCSLTPMLTHGKFLLSKNGEYENLKVSNRISQNLLVIRKAFVLVHNILKSIPFNFGQASYNL